MAEPIWRLRPVAWLLALPIRAYRRWLSPVLPAACRFYPSCSQYALWSLQTHPPLRAVGLATWRLLRCQPLSQGGLDWPPPGQYGDAQVLASVSAADWRNGGSAR